MYTADETGAFTRILVGGYYGRWAVFEPKTRRWFVDPPFFDYLQREAAKAAAEGREFPPASLAEIIGHGPVEIVVDWENKHTVDLRTSLS